MAVSGREPSQLDETTRFRAAEAPRTVLVVDDEAARGRVLAWGATAIRSKPVPLKGLWAALGSDQEDAVTPARAARRPARPEPTPSAGGTPVGRVLIVDDEADVRSTLQQYVATQGCEARVAADGASALRLIRADPPDVVLLDIQMPG